MSSTASNVMFWIGVGFSAVAFGTSVATNFIKNEKAKSIVNWVAIGSILAATACFVTYDVIK